MTTEQQAYEILEALRELVALKELKDKEGKTHDYNSRQPLAWITAKRIIVKYKNLGIKA